MTVLGRHETVRGLRRLDPSRDLRQVAALITETFGANLDAEGRTALRELQQVSRLGPLVRLLLSADPQLQRMLNGYVWIDDGRVVGNLTLHSSPHLGSRWYIYNVAVAPSHRGHGIARALVRAALEEVQREGGGWATLQVEEDNEPALRLYQGLGFDALSAIEYLRLPAPETVSEAPAPLPLLRPWHPDDWCAEFELAKASTPSALQWWQPLRSGDFQRYPEQQLGEWFDRLIGRRRVYRWVVEPPQGAYYGLAASLLVRMARWRGEHQLRLMVHPDARGELEEPLVQRAVGLLASHPRGPTTTRHPSEHQAAIEALLAHGFERRRTLVVMRKRVP